MKRYYFADSNNKPRGPVNFEDLKALAAAGSIRDNTSVFPEGAKEWVKWIDVLKAETPAPPAPALPPALAPAPAPQPQTSAVTQTAISAPAPVRTPAPTLITQTPASAVAPAPAAVTQTAAPAPAAYTPAPATVYNPAPQQTQQPVYTAPEPQPAQTYTPPAATVYTPAPAPAPAQTAPAPAPVQSGPPSLARSGPPGLPAQSSPAPVPAAAAPAPAPRPQPEPEPIISLEDISATAAPATTTPDPATAWLETPTEPVSQHQQQQAVWPPPSDQSGAVTTAPSAGTALSTTTAPAETAPARRTGPRMRRETRETLSGTSFSPVGSTSSGDSNTRSAARAREQMKQMQNLNWGKFFWGLVLVFVQCFTIPWTLIANSALTLSRWGTENALPTKESEFPALTFLLVVIRPCIHIVFTIVGIIASLVGAVLPFLVGINLTAIISASVSLFGGLVGTYFLNIYIALIFEGGALLLSIYNSIKSMDSKMEDRNIE
ncbi:MAG TPA: DUF4339 domain-containing protein [Candidatus Methylacidiphilales bacterium]|nr:DUF4339 domain-containing protein [Candidatus Methylacidiphilales bacterium]